MNKKLIPYKILYYLSLIPLIGMLIAWICSWLNIYRRTNDKKYIIFNWLIWILPLFVVGGFTAICAMTFMVDFSPVMKTVCGIVISYIDCLIVSISCISISKAIIKRYDLKSVV